MSIELRPYLEDLERRIDPAAERIMYEHWVAFSEGELTHHDFTTSIPKRTARAPGIAWPSVSVNQALEDTDLMVLSQLKSCSDTLATASNHLMFMRPNYGVGILPTVFGSKVFLMDDAANTLPNVYPSGEEAVRRIVAQDLPDLENGWGKQVFEVGRKFASILEHCPNIAAHVRIDHPDCQGPIDLCELIWGSEMFLAFYDEPDLVHALLEKVTGQYLRFVGRWWQTVPRQDGYHAYFHRLHKGAVTIRNDSLMNLSPEVYREFAFPYDQQILKDVGGGMVHFCGTGNHFIPHMSSMDQLYAVDLSQPHLNDMDLILTHTADKGINLHTCCYSSERETALRHNAEHISL